MKNNFSKFKFLFLIFCLILQSQNVDTKEINLKAIEILTREEGNVIIGNNNAEAKIPGEFEIYADKLTYNKKRIF